MAAKQNQVAPFVAAIKNFILKAGDFQGRATRAELWWPILALVCLSVVMTVVFAVISVASTALFFSGYGFNWNAFGQIFGLLFERFFTVAGALTFLPWFALLVRRFRDVKITVMLPVVYCGLCLVGMFVPAFMTVTSGIFSVIDGLLGLAVIIIAGFIPGKK